MPTACINNPECRVYLRNNMLEIVSRPLEDGQPEVLRTIPIRDLERLVIMESVQITSQALAALLRAKVPINILGWNGEFLGCALPAQNSHGRFRLTQYRRSLEPEFVLKISRNIVSAKIYNQRRVLQRILASRNTQTTDNSEDSEPSLNTDQRQLIQTTIERLETFFPMLNSATTIDEVRGIEGASTSSYFKAWSALLPAEFPFERRSTRPPLNPVNAVISFCATIIYSEEVAFLHAHGLDPALGLLHATEDGRWSLALDLIEPFRPAIVEAIALDLFSHRILNNNHFEDRNGGVYLNEEGRKKFFLQYERRMERQFMSECVGHRTSLRQQLENQAVMYKSALQNPDLFEPFLIN